MGLLELESTGVVFASSTSESKRFGLETVRVTVGLKALESPNDAIDQVHRSLDSMSGDLAIVRYPTQFTRLAGSLGMREEHLFPAGSLLYWRAPDGQRKAEQRPQDIAIANRDGGATVAEAQLVIADSFAGYKSHYSCNPHLNVEVVAQGYSEWATMTLSDPTNELFVLRDGGVPAGVAVVATKGGTWEIELAGIATSAQGKGYYPMLLDAVADRSRRVSARLVISTQAHNTRVQKLWAKAGFVPVDSFDTVHLSRRDVSIP